jgi:hypothetical protein
MAQVFPSFATLRPSRKHRINMINIPRAFLSTASTTRGDSRRFFADIVSSATEVYVFRHCESDAAFGGTVVVVRIL